MTDEFGIVSRRADDRARFGDRQSHGKVSTPPVDYRPDPPKPAQVNPFGPREVEKPDGPVIRWP